MFNLENKIIKTKNPHLYKCKKSGSDAIADLVLHMINEYIKKTKKTEINLLDIGGGKGWGSVLYKKKNINYYCLDLKESKRTVDINYIKGDITNVNLEMNIKFDIIFSKDTFEHILNPWDATSNFIKFLENDGFILIFTPFSWRYHASPYDTYRYTHTGLQYITERLGKIKKIKAGYINFGNINGFWKNKKDHTMDGKPHLNCIESFYIGIKDENYLFSKNNLDSDLSWDHKQ